MIIEQLTSIDEAIEELSELLIKVVDEGASGIFRREKFHILSNRQMGN
ncbi:hypothetical protein [Robertmurraya massiliosenegalensis]|nr:hypothetical protein [Robertmurraya massiliosenegalensis]